MYGKCNIVGTKYIEYVGAVHRYTSCIHIHVPLWSGGQKGSGVDAADQSQMSKTEVVYRHAMARHGTQ